MFDISNGDWLEPKCHEQPSCRVARIARRPFTMVSHISDPLSQHPHSFHCNLAAIFLKEAALGDNLVTELLGYVCHWLTTVACFYVSGCRLFLGLYISCGSLSSSISIRVIVFPEASISQPKISARLLVEYINWSHCFTIRNMD